MNSCFFISNLYPARARAACLVLLSLCLATAVSAQDEEELQLLSAPPPIKIVTKEERASLGSVDGPKDRTRLALAMMESRLKRAEQFRSEGALRAMFTELGGFHGLLEHNLDFLLGIQRTNRKTAFRELKRYELGLRALTPKLELIRREVPLAYEGYIRGLLKNLRDARTKAIEPFFDDTVVPVADNKDQ